MMIVTIFLCVIVSNTIGEKWYLIALVFIFLVISIVKLYLVLGPPTPAPSQVLHILTLLFYFCSLIPPSLSNITIIAS